MTDEERRRGFEAKREYAELEAAFEAVHDAYVGQLQEVTNQDGAYRVAVGLQVLEKVKSLLMTAAANADLAAHEEDVRRILD
ncbi:MAG: hypothetical protein VX529_10965 [Pseudomonadota bacterium]|nr:hypothetical protein [Pseudomonadota bacterium]